MNLNPLFQDNRSETQSFGANMECSMTCAPDCRQSCPPSVWSTRGVQPTMQTLTDNSGLACTTWKYIAMIFSHCRCGLSPTHLLGCTFQTVKHPAVHFVQNGYSCTQRISPHLIVRTLERLDGNTAPCPFKESTTFLSLLQTHYNPEWEWYTSNQRKVSINLTAEQPPVTHYHYRVPTPLGMCEV